MGMFTSSEEEERKAEYSSNPHWFGEEEEAEDIPKIGIKSGKRMNELEKDTSWFGIEKDKKQETQQEDI